MARATYQLHGQHSQQEPTSYNYCGRTIMVPEPHAFPRDAFLSAASEHERLLRQFCQSAVFPEPDRVVLSNKNGVDEAAGVVGFFRPKDAADTLVQGVLPRHTLIHLLRASYHGVRRRLFVLPPEDWILPVFVQAAGAASLNHVLVEHRRSGRVPQLRILERDLVVEPKGQTHWPSGDDSQWTVTRWRRADTDEAFYAWTPTPRTPADEIELIDRIVASYEEQIIDLVRADLTRSYAPREMIVALASTECCGDSLDVWDRAPHWDFTAAYPTLGRAIASEAHPGRIPIFVVTERYGGLRWLQVSDRGRVELEASGSVVTRPIGVIDPRETYEFLVPQSRRGHAPRDGVLGEVDRLVGMTDGQVDAEIILAGFEPAVERARGPGLREQVLEAIAARRRSAEEGMR